MPTFVKTGSPVVFDVDILPYERGDWLRPDGARFWAGLYKTEKGKLSCPCSAAGTTKGEALDNLRATVNRPEFRHNGQKEQMLAAIEQAGNGIV